MQVLTPSGYVDINDLNIGDAVVAYDVNTGAEIINHLEGKTLWTPDMYPAEYTVGHYDENGDWVPPVLVNTSYEVFQRIQGDWIFYRINGTFDFYKSQSVWANMNVVHAKDLQIGDVIYNDQDGDVVVASIEIVEDPFWWKLEVSGDSSYIADGLTLHNASRYWVGGGSSTNWNATANTNWSATSGGANNASVPTSADGVFFDDLGNSNSVISAGITVLSLSISSGHTATMTHNALLQVGGNVTFGANYTIAGTSNLQLNATATITSNGKTWPNGLTLSVAPGTFTLVGDLTINGILYVGAYNGAPAAVVNKTTTEKLIVNGGLAGGIGTGPNYINGTAALDFYGSTWTAVQTGVPMTVYGIVALSGTNLGSYGGFTNLGTINAGTSTFNGNGPNFNSNGAVFNNFTTGYGTLTLTSNLTVNGLFFNNGNQNINKTTNEVVYAYGGLTQGTENQTFGGTATIILKGGTWTAGTFTNAPFAMPITIDGNISMGGSLLHGGSSFTYVSGVITRITTATLNLSNSTQTFTFDAGANMQVPIILNGGTKTLLGNFSTGGLVTINANTTVNKTTTETFTLYGGITHANNITLSGTTKLIAAAGDFSSFVGGGLAVDVDIAGNITINSNITFGGTAKTIKYVSGSITGAGSIWIGGTPTLDLNGITISQTITFSAVVTLASNLTCNSISSSGGATINKTTTQTVTVNTSISIGNNGLAGTAEIICKGGTITTGGNSKIGNPFTFDGNITIAGTIFYYNGSYLKYLSGTNNASSIQLNATSISSYDVSGMTWGSLALPDGFTPQTLVSNLNIIGATSLTFACNINTSTSAKLITGGLLLSASIGGTAAVELSGGVWRGNFAVNSPFVFNGSSAISGSVQYGGSLITYTSGSVTSSAANLTFTNSTQTLALSGSNINCPMTFAGGTKTLSTDFNNNALVTISGATAVNRAVSQSFNINGGLTVNAGLSGTATVVLSSGSWSGASTVTSNLTFNGNPTISGNVYYGTGTLGYISGTPIVTGSTLNLTANCTLNTSTMGWNNLTISSGATYTLASDLRINGLLSAAVGGGTAINRTTSEVIYCYGGFNIGNNFTGTAGIIAKSGTLISNGFAAISGPALTIDGDVTISGTFTYGGSGTMTYLSGNAITSGTTLSVGSATLNTKGIIWNDVAITDAITLTSNMTVNGSLRNNNGSFVFKTTNEELYVRGGYNVANFWMQGNGTIVLQGGTWTGAAGTYTLPTVVIDGDVTLGANANVGNGGAVSYRSGRILSGSLNLTGNCTVIDFHECPIPNVVVTTGATVTMNEFFTGTPTKPAVISASTALGQYTVTFTDSFEKIGKNVVATGCVPSQPLQLILPYTTRTSAVKTTNRGIRYTNQSPNSISKNSKITPPLTPTGLLVSDPNFKTP